MNDIIKEELMDVFEKWCAEYVDPNELPLEFQRSQRSEDMVSYLPLDFQRSQRSEDMVSYDSIVTRVFWMGWLGGYGCGIEQSLALNHQ